MTALLLLLAWLLSAPVVALLVTALFRAGALEDAPLDDDGAPLFVPASWTTTTG